MVCEGDPRVSTFILTRRVLEKETIKIRRKGLGHVGIPKDIKRRALQKYLPVESESTSSSSFPSAQDVPAIEPSGSNAPPDHLKNPQKSAFVNQPTAKSVNPLHLSLLNHAQVEIVSFNSLLFGYDYIHIQIMARDIL